jgi:hypothetical protein
MGDRLPAQKSRSKSLPEKDVRPANAICVRHHTDNVKAEAMIKRQGMASPTAYCTDRLWKRRV